VKKYNALIKIKGHSGICVFSWNTLCYFYRGNDTCLAYLCL